MKRPEDNRIHIQSKQPPLEKRAPKAILPLLAIALFFLFWGSLLLIVPYSQFHFTPAWVFEHVKTRFSQLFLFLLGGSSYFAATFYQYMAVLFVGSALAACGTIFQGGFRNALAGPSSMGVMSGGSIGALIYLLAFTSGTSELVNTTVDWNAYENQSFFDLYAQQLFVLIGCFAGVFLVLLAAHIAGGGKLSGTAMLLSGTVLSSISSEGMVLVRYYLILNNPADTRLDALQTLMMGSFSGITSLRTLLLLNVPILICIGVLMLLRGKLNLLSLGEDEAAAMGLNVRNYRYGMILIGTILTAQVVAYCGRIGFLGFMIPLVGRRLVGPNMRRLLPASILLGAILLILVYDLACILNLTDYINLFTSSIGGVVMLISLLSGKGGTRDASFQRGTAGGMAPRSAH